MQDFSLLLKFLQSRYPLKAFARHLFKVSREWFPALINHSFNIFFFWWLGNRFFGFRFLVIVTTHWGY